MGSGAARGGLGGPRALGARGAARTLAWLVVAAAALSALNAALLAAGPERSVVLTLSVSAHSAASVPAQPSGDAAAGAGAVAGAGSLAGAGRDAAIVGDASIGSARVAAASAASAGVVAGRAGQVTLVLMTHADSLRHAQVVSLARTYSAMARVVAKTVVVVNGMAAPSGLSGLSRVAVVEFARNSMNNRFAVSAHVDTEAVVVLDDDLLLSEGLLECMLSHFERDPNRLVSLDVRYTNAGRYGFHEVNVSEAQAGTLGLGRTMLFSRRFLRDYSSRAQLVRWVDAPHYCEDVLMSALIANRTGRGPLFVRTDAEHWRKELSDAGGGLHQGTGWGSWVRQRHECVRWANAYFADPFRVSDVVVGCGGSHQSALEVRVVGVRGGVSGDGARGVGDVGNAPLSREQSAAAASEVGDAALSPDQPAAEAAAVAPLLEQEAKANAKAAAGPGSEAGPEAGAEAGTEAGTEAGPEPEPKQEQEPEPEQQQDQEMELGGGLVARTNRLASVFDETTMTSTTTMTTSSMVRPPVVWVVTPTVASPARHSNLVRVSQALMLDRGPIVWVVVEDAREPSRELGAFLRETGLPHIHAATPSIRNASTGKLLGAFRGVDQRNVALDAVQAALGAERPDGVVYFADDDNVYHHALFRELRRLRKDKDVGTLAVGFAGNGNYERCVLDEQGRVAGFATNFRAKRRFPIDMAGVVLSTRVLRGSTRWRLPADGAKGLLEDAMLQSLVRSPAELQPLGNCSKVWVWHVKRDKTPTYGQRVKGDAASGLLASLV